jgi:type VI secretion system protein ImpK
MATAIVDQPRVASATTPRSGGLALALQEAFTAAVRLRASRQVATDAVSFRAHIKQLLAAANRDAREQGYGEESARLAVYAFIAFLDESVLNSDQPMFSEWPRQPLQEEIFGDHLAGEIFYRHLQDLVGRQDSDELADVLEVFELCLLLGFRGRYGGNRDGVLNMLSVVDQKIQRIRGRPPELSRHWALMEGEVIAVAKDPWIPRLALAAGVAFAVAAILFVIFSLILGSGFREIQQVVTDVVR